MILFFYTSFFSTFRFLWFYFIVCVNCAFDCCIFVKIKSTFDRYNSSFHTEESACVLFFDEYGFLINCIFERIAFFFVANSRDADKVTRTRARDTRVRRNVGHRYNERLQVVSHGEALVPPPPDRKWIVTQASASYEITIARFEARVERDVENKYYTARDTNVFFYAVSAVKSIYRAPVSRWRDLR